MLQAAVRENIAGVGERVSWLDGGQTLEIRLSGGRVLRASRVRRLSLGRFDVEGEITLIDSGHVRRLSTPAISSNCCARRASLRTMIPMGVGGSSDSPGAGQQCRQSHTVVRWRGPARTRALLRRPPPWAFAHSLEYVERMMADDPTFSPLAFYEQWVVEGHPLHPCPDEDRDGSRTWSGTRPNGGQRRRWPWSRWPGGVSRLLPRSGRCGRDPAPRASRTSGSAVAATLSLAGKNLRRLRADPGPPLADAPHASRFSTPSRSAAARSCRSRMPSSPRWP